MNYISNAPLKFIHNAMEDIGMLTPLDEQLNHQIADTFSTA